MKKEMTTTAYEYFCDECNESIKNKYNCKLCGKIVCEKCKKEYLDSETIKGVYCDDCIREDGISLCMLQSIDKEIREIYKSWLRTRLRSLDLEEIDKITFYYDYDLDNLTTLYRHLGEFKNLRWKDDTKMELIIGNRWNKYEVDIGCITDFRILVKKDKSS